MRRQPLITRLKYKWEISDLLTILAIAALVVLMASTAIAAPKYVDKKTTTHIPLASGNFIQVKWPAKVFSWPIWKVDGIPACRQGYGQGWVKVMHPRSRGESSHFYVEVVEREGEITHKHFANEYWNTGIAEPTSNGFQEIVSKDGKLKKGKFAGMTAYRGFLKVKASNAQGTAYKGNSVVWICMEKKTGGHKPTQFIIFTSESLQPDGDESAILKDACRLVKTAGSEGPYKVLDQTQAIYRYMTFNPSPGFMPDYTGDHPGHFALWHRKVGGGTTESVLKLKGFYGGPDLEYDKWIEKAERAIRTTYGVDGGGDAPNGTRYTWEKIKIGKGKAPGHMATYFDDKKSRFNPDEKRQFVCKVYLVMDEMVWTLTIQNFPVTDKEITKERAAMYQKEFQIIVKSLFMWSARP